MTSPAHLQFDQLLALPITGEAFLLRRQGRTVVVDGGWKKDKIVRALVPYVPASKTLDVVVCTHGDGDHAGGLVDLLKLWPGKIGQLWLPGRWVDVVPELLRDPKGFVDGLIKDLDTLDIEDFSDGARGQSAADLAATMDDRVIAERDAARDSSAELASTDSASSARRTKAALDIDDVDTVDLGGTEPIDEPDWFADLRRTARELRPTQTASRAFKSGRQRIRSRKAKGQISGAVATFWLELIDTGEAIRGIAEAAIGRSLRIRWFDFDAFSRTRRPLGGVPNFLEPMNGIEQAPPALKVSYLARLSPINRQSLIFLAPPTHRRLGVLFCGDSPLGDGRNLSRSFLCDDLRPRWPIVATAPHHGAETNRAAYGHMNAWADVIVLLRAGGDQDQPGPTFKSFSRSFKLCATCPQSGRMPALAGVAATGRWLAWLPVVVMGQPCVCA